MAKEPWIFGARQYECAAVSSLLRSGELQFILFTPILEGSLEGPGEQAAGERSSLLQSRMGRQRI